MQVLAGQRFSRNTGRIAVRWFASTLAGSIAVHAVLGTVAYLMPRPAPPAVIELPEPDVAVVDVEAPPPPLVITPIALDVVLPAAAAPPPAPAPAAASAAPQNASVARAISSGTRTAETAADPGAPGAGTTPPGDAGSNPLTMRAPGKPRLTVGPSEALIAIALGGTPPPPIPESGRLAPAGGDRAQINDLAFTGDVAPDGTVHLRDKPNFHIHLALPSPKSLGHGIAKWAEDPYAIVNAAEDPKYGERATRGDHAALKADDQKPDGPQTVPIVGGGFDVTDYIARKALGRAGDPYAARKRAALDATRDERVEMGRRHKLDQLSHVDALMKDTLDKVWAASGDRAWTRGALFDLWDDGAEEGDPAVVAAADRARGDVIGFIRAHLPAGSPDAYTTDELAKLNGRRSSKARFEPY
jgi:hypothetical protein